MHLNKHELHFCERQSWHCGELTLWAQAAVCGRCETGDQAVITAAETERARRHCDTEIHSFVILYIKVEEIEGYSEAVEDDTDEVDDDEDDEQSGCRHLGRSVRYGRGLWPVSSDSSDSSDQVPGCGHRLRWAASPGPARPVVVGRLANVWCRPCHEPGHVTAWAAWAAWHPALARTVTLGLAAECRGPGTLSRRHSPDPETPCHHISDMEWHYHKTLITHKELRVTLSVLFESSPQQNNKNFTPPWSFYFGPVLIFQSRRAEVYLIVSIRISQPIKSFIGAVSWEQREKKVVLNPRHVQRSFELGQWSIELLRYISFKISSWPFQNWICKWNRWILFYATFQLIDQHYLAFRSARIVKR